MNVDVKTDKKLGILTVVVEFPLRPGREVEKMGIDTRGVIRILEERGIEWGSIVAQATAVNYNPRRLRGEWVFALPTVVEPVVVEETIETTPKVVNKSKEKKTKVTTES